MLIDIGFFVVAAILIFIILKLRKGGKPAEVQQPQVPQQQPNQRRWARANQQEQSEQEGQSEQSDQQGKYEGLTQEQVRKKMKKQQKAREKKARQQQIQQRVKVMNDKQQKYRQREQQKEKEEQQKRLKEEEYLRKIQEQDQKKKQEEYKKWKDFFTVESEGKDKKTPEQELAEKQEFNKQFLKYIVETKICLLEDMSSEFKLQTKEIVDKIKEFEGEGLISGVFDQRGKYINVTDSEWKAISSYMRAKGRVSKSQMMMECADIIKFEGTRQKDKSLLDLIDKQEEVKA